MALHNLVHNLLAAFMLASLVHARNCSGPGHTMRLKLIIVESGTESHDHLTLQLNNRILGDSRDNCHA
jgi:hypothetical protein